MGNEYKSIFSIKKKPIQGSGYGSSYASNPANQNSVSKFGSNVMSGNGISAVQGLFQPKLTFANRQTNQSTQPNQSVAPNQSMAPKLIQGSGMTSQYAQNPTNYKPPVTQPPKVETMVKSQPDAFTTRLNEVTNRGKSQQEFAENARKQQEDYIRQQYQLSNQQLGEALPAAQEQFNRFKDNTEASIADLLAGGERQKAQAADYQGEAQRKAAQTLRETQGQTGRTFAGLNTLDSRGEGSYQQANENQMSEFNRYTQQGLRALADKKAEIDATVGQAERSARATITQEKAKLNELEISIQYAVANNNLQQARELTDAYNTTKQYIYDIEDSVSQMKYQFALEQQKLDNELATAQSFTPEFMAGGPPTNQAEYEFFIKNQKDLQSAYGTDGGSDSQTKVNSIIGQLKNYNTQGITGLMRFGLSGESRNAEGLLKQLSSELQLEESKRLKGQGSMSDAERAILANSVAAFNLDKNGRPQVTDERFKEILDELAGGFAGGQQAEMDPAVQAYLQANGL